MRIAIFTESYEPIINGVSVSVASLRDGLRERGHDVYVFAPRFPGYESDKEGVFRFPSRMSRYAQGYPIPVPFAPDIQRSFEKLKPDVVHTQTPFFLGLVGMKWAKRIAAPIVSTNHTLYTEYLHYVPFLPQAFTKAVLLRHMRRYYGRCSAVIVPSKPVEDLLRQMGVKRRIEIVKSGVRQFSILPKQEVRRSFGIPDDTFLLLYVGRIAREKNLSLLLMAFQMIRRDCPDVKLMVAGSGPYEKECRDLAAALKLEDDVIFPGMLDRSEVIRAYSAADVFVFPSLTETQGMVVSEAFMAGLPCVAVRAGGIPEVVTDGTDGILTSNSAEDFSNAVIRLIRDPGLRERLSSGAVRSSSGFTVESMAVRFEEVYMSEVEKERGQRIWNTSCR